MSFTLNQLDANTAAPSSITQAIQSRLPSSTSTSPIIIPTSASSSSNSNDPYDYNSSAFTTSWITYLAIIVVAGVLVALISSRYFYIRRYYASPSFRAYFLPQNGIHLNFLNLHIKGAPNRTRQPTITTLQEVYGASSNQRGEERRERRRRRRNRQTVGQTLGPGGTRIGDGDLDDGWDYDDIDLVEQGRGGGGIRGELPQYQADSGLPAYAAPPIPTISTSTTTTLTPGGGAGEDEVDNLPTAAEYEALSRGNRDLSSSVPTYPPPVHVHGSTSLYPSEPPPSFSRANSGISTRSRRSQRPTTTNLNIENENDSSSTFETQPEEVAAEERRRRMQEERRRQSTATASSSASKLDDDEGDDQDSIKMVQASASSKVTLGSSSSNSTSNDSTNDEKKEEEDPQHKEQ
ncbi:hypothetical protein JCM3765_000606 [Sporobolomyces pararoseus]